MTTKSKSLIVGALGYTAEMVIFVLLLLCARYILCASESRATYFYDWYMVSDTLMSVSGVAKVIGALLTQFFVTPTTALVIVALLLTLTTGLTVIITHQIAAPKVLITLAFAPSLALTFVHYDPTYSIVGTVSFVIALIGVICALACRRAGLAWLQIIILIATYALAGAYGLLAAIIVFVSALKRRWVWTIYPIVAIVTICIWAWVGVRCGDFMGLTQALTPAQYYIGWQPAPVWAWLPGGVLLFVVVVDIMSSGWTPKTDTAGSIVILMNSLIIFVLGYVGYKAFAPRSEEDFAKLSYYVTREQWPEVVTSAHDINLDDTRLQNCLNLALAEKGQLAKTLFQHPCHGPASIIDLAHKSPEMYMLLSDVFYSMGHLSLAQKYAFEANVGVGNLSPRMLKRLIDLNILSGQYQVAEKYINLLERTLHYAEWCAQRRRLLYDDAAVAADADLGPKLGCRGVENRFAGVSGIESDLRHILRHNPKHAITMDYLGCLYLLSKNVPAFTDAVTEFYGTDALPTTLPKHFQEGIAVASLATDQDLSQRYRLHPSVIENCRSFWSKGKQQPNTFWHYLKYSKLD